MTCARFLEAFSDYRDGLADEPLRRRVEAHLRACPDCRRYERVVERGLELLRGEEPLDVPEDFRPRLKHRLYHVDDARALRGHANSGATGMAVLGMALLLTVVAWSPLLTPPEPELELSPIVVSRPPSPLRLRPVALGFQERAPFSAVRQVELWNDAPALFFQYSPVSQRYRQRALLRSAGLDATR